MRQVTQTILYDPDSPAPGNCLQAAVASLLDLDLDDVPHFIVHEDWLERMVLFARLHGYRIVLDQTGDPVALGIAYGPSPRGVNHAVVVQDGHTVWDPHPSRAGLLRVSGVYAWIPAAPSASPR